VEKPLHQIETDHQLNKFSLFYNSMNTPAPLIRIGWLRALLFFGVSFVMNEAFFALAYLVLETIGVDTYALSEKPELLPFLIATILTQGIMIIALVWVFRRFIDDQSMHSLGFSIKGRIGEFAGGFMTGAIIIGTGFLILWQLDYIEIVRWQFQPWMMPGHFLLFTVVAIQEEVANRGYMLSNFLDSMPKVPALICSSIIFGVLHAFNPNLSEIGFFNIILGGVLMGLFYVYKRNLWFPIGVHLSWNFVQGPVLGFSISGQDLGKNTMIIQRYFEPEWMSGGSFGFEGSVVAGGLVILGILLIFILNRV
jgi:membrane protease YdiL (CAAX protease family)